MKRSRRHKKTLELSELHTVGDFCSAMETISPVGLAQSWDNVGLIAGDKEAALRRGLFAIDLTQDVLDEAIQTEVNLLLTYHPPIFKPIANLRTPGNGMDAFVFQCIRAGIALYSPHTALDAADGGTNDVLARLSGAETLAPLMDVEAPGGRHVKMVIYVPVADTDKVAYALFNAGAGHIGKYSHCSFRSRGQGTFMGGPETNPAIGKPGRFEEVEEIRLETIVPRPKLAAVVSAMRSAHPYEEPAFDLFDVRPEPAAGIGRIGTLSRPTSLSALAARLAKATKAKAVQFVGSRKQPITKVIVVAGAAGSLPFQRPLSPDDCIVTGEMRHHDALTVRRLGCSAVVLGHWQSERPVLASLARRISKLLPGASWTVSRADHDPFDR